MTEGVAMPTFHRLSAEEIAALRPRRTGSVDLSEYRQFLQDLAPGEGGEIVLGPDDQRRTIKRRLTTAANQMNKKVQYRRSTDDVLRFEVLVPAGR
jgi:hypothetical protein